MTRALRQLYRRAVAARAEEPPGGEVDVLVDVADRTVREAEVHAARMIAPGRDERPLDTAVHAVPALEVRRHRVAVHAGGGERPAVVLEPGVANAGEAA